MKLKRVKLKNLEKYSLCVLKDGQWVAFRAVLDAVPDDGTNEHKKLENASDDLIAFLKDRTDLQPKLEELIAIAQTNNAELILDSQDVMPFRPLLYREFMLYEKHVINSSRGFVKRSMPKAAIVTKIFEVITRKTFPMFLPKKPWYENPVYYKGNVLSFVADGETVTFPKYATLKDYELELGMIITKDVLNASEEEGFGAIGAFCVFNDFSARNVQIDEMRKTGFGPCKAKDFSSSISSVVVTADEILPVLDTLITRVFINNIKVAEGEIKGLYHSLGEAVAYASKGERVYAGEFMATGTIPNCCGMENGVLLECGDVIRLEIDRIGELTNPISKSLL